MDALRKSEASNRETETDAFRLLEEQCDPELGLPEQKKDYITIDFDGMVGLVDTSAHPSKAPPKPPRGIMKRTVSQESSNFSQSPTSRTSVGSDPMSPRNPDPVKPPRRSTQRNF